MMNTQSGATAFAGREIDHFVCAYDPTSNSNPYAQAYADLKTKLAAGDSPIASSIADA